MENRPDFEYVNVNPEGAIENDCVCRAISYVSKDSYYGVEDKLFYVSKLLQCPKLCVCCYNFLIEKYYCFKKMDVRKMPVKEFARIYNNGLYLVRMEGHISVVEDGKIRDTWYCGDEILTHAWRAY